MAKYKVTMICREIRRAERVVQTESADLEEVKDRAWSTFDAIKSCDLEQENFTKIELIVEEQEHGPQSKERDMTKTQRCPECHVAIIPDEVILEWKRKWGTGTKPHYSAPCKICGKPYGIHFGTECPERR